MRAPYLQIKHDQRFIGNGVRINSLVLPLPHALDELFATEIKLAQLLLALELLLNHALQHADKCMCHDMVLFGDLRGNASVVASGVVQSTLAAHAVPA